MKTETEIELKLTILDTSAFAPECYDDFLIKLQKMLGGKNNKHHIKVLSNPPQSLETAYYDTKDLDLRKSKIAYRVRSEQGEKIATIKTDIPVKDPSSGVIAHRLEKTVKLSDETSPEGILEAFKGTEMADLLKPILGRKALHLLFTTKFDRHSYVIEQENKMKILLCMDTGKIMAGKNVGGINEIELELMEGDPYDLFHVASFISGMIPVNIETRSKYARGLVLSGKVPLKEVAVSKPVKSYSIPSEPQTFERFIQAAISHIHDHLIYYKYAIEAHTSDYEAVHAFRVLLRHFTSITALSKPVSSGKEIKQMRDLAKNILKKSAKTRETDIFFHNWKEFLSSLDEDQQVIGSKISSILIARRQFERAEFQRSFCDGNFASLLLLIAKWRHTIQKFDGEAVRTDEYLSEFIMNKDLLIRELSSGIESLKPRKLHKIRLAAKEKRYILRYFPTKLSSDDLLSETEKLKHLQDLLGGLNDIEDNLNFSCAWIPECPLADEFIKWLKLKGKTLYSDLCLYLDSISD